MDKKTTVIINSKCLRISRKRSIRSLMQQLENEEDKEVFMTEYPGHAAELAREATGSRYIIAIGGDGTIFEVINNMDMDKQILGLMPFGTGNSLARDLNLLSGTKEPLSVSDCAEKQIDLIQCEYRDAEDLKTAYISSTSGIGFICRVTEVGTRYLKGIKKFCYPVAAALCCLGQKKSMPEVRINDGPAEKMDLTNLAVNNTVYAGNFKLFPGADLSDARFNIIFLKSNYFSQLAFILGVLSEKYFCTPGERIFARKLHFKLKEPQRLMLDGEIVGPVSEATFSIVPKALKVRYSP